MLVLALLSAANCDFSSGSNVWAREQDEPGDWLPRLDLMHAGEVVLVAWSDSTSSGRSVLEVVNNEARRTHVADVDDPMIAISADGKDAAYSHHALSPGQQPMGIFVYDSARNESRRLTSRSDPGLGVPIDRPWEPMRFDAFNRVIWAAAITQSGTPMTFAINATTLTGETTTLAKFDKLSHFQLSPDRTSLAIAAATERSAMNALWLVDLETNARELVWEDADVRFIAWMDDKSGLLLGKGAAVEQPDSGQVADVFTAEHLTPGHVYRWTKQNTMALPLSLGGDEPGQFTISPDGRYLAIEAWRPFDDPTGVAANLWLADLASGRTRGMTEGTLVAGPGHFSHDSRLLAYGSTTTRTSEDQVLQVDDLDTHRTYQLNPEGTWAAWGFPSSFTWSPTDPQLFFFSNMSRTDPRQAARAALWTWARGELSHIVSRPNEPLSNSRDSN